MANSFLIDRFSQGFGIFVFFDILRWFNFTNMSPHSPDDGSLEPKRYSVDFISQ